MMFSPALASIGEPQAAGLCSQTAHLLVVADFVRRSEELGTTQASRAL